MKPLLTSLLLILNAISFGQLDDAFVNRTIEEIDSIYGISRDEQFTPKVFRPDSIRKMGIPLVHNPSKMYSYGNFYFSRFENKKTAKKVFQRICHFYKDASEIKEVEYWHLFDKGGFFYLLKDHYIIHKIGRCGSSLVISLNHANRLYYYLHSGRSKREKYFLRFICGYENHN